MSLGEYVVEQWWTSLDYIRGVWFIGLEILRNSADLLMPMHEGCDAAAPSSPSSSLPPRLQLRRRMNQYHQLRNTPLPELLEDDNHHNSNNNNDNDHNHHHHHHHLQSDQPFARMEQEKERNESASSGRIQKWNQRELEPAFLKDSDYPVGWMVFHPILGVVLKEEADRYNDESKRKGTPEVEEEKESTESVLHPAAMQSQSASRNGEKTAEARGVMEHPPYKDDNSSRDRSQSPIRGERESGIPHLRSIAASG